jgi:hypothetical protein
MILGRNTQQWLGLITAAAAVIQTLVVVLLPDVDPGTVAIVLGSLTGFLGVLIAFIANTYTTPIQDPRLMKGTMIQVTDEDGIIVGHTPVPQPDPVPLADA